MKCLTGVGVKVLKHAQGYYYVWFCLSYGLKVEWACGFRFKMGWSGFGDLGLIINKGPFVLVNVTIRTKKCKTCKVQGPVM